MAAALLISLAVVWCAPGLRPSRRLALTILPTIAILLSESRSGLFGGVILAAVLIARALRRSRSSFRPVFSPSPASRPSRRLFCTSEVCARRRDGHLVRRACRQPPGRAAAADTASPRYGDGSRGASRAAIRDQLPRRELLASHRPRIRPARARSVPRAPRRPCGPATRSRTSAGFLAAAALSATVVSQIVLPTLQESPVSFPSLDRRRPRRRPRSGRKKTPRRNRSRAPSAKSAR